MSYVEERIQEIHLAESKIPIFKNLEKQTRGNGRTVYYYRAGKGKRIRLPDRTRVSEDEFKRAYQAAANGETAARPNETRAIVPKQFSPIGSPGYVYFAKVGNEVKIGFTKDIRSRTKAIQTASALPIEIVAIIPGSSGTELFFHERFADYRVGGEWFRLVGILTEFLRILPSQNEGNRQCR